MDESAAAVKLYGYGSFSGLEDKINFSMEILDIRRGSTVGCLAER